MPRNDKKDIALTPTWKVFICILKGEKKERSICCETTWWDGKAGGEEQLRKIFNFDSETHICKIAILMALLQLKTETWKCCIRILLLSLSTNCKNAALKLTQNTSGKVIATNGCEVCKIGHYYPVIISLNRQSRGISQVLGSFISQSWEKFEKSGKLSFILH